MMKFLVTVVSFLLPLTLVAAEPPAITVRTVNAYNKQLDILDKQYERALEELQAKYKSEVRKRKIELEKDLDEQLLASTQSGNLDEALAIRALKQNAINEPSLPVEQAPTKRTFWKALEGDRAYVQQGPKSWIETDAKRDYEVGRRYIEVFRNDDFVELRATDEPSFYVRLHASVFYHVGQKYAESGDRRWREQKVIARGTWTK